MGGIWVYAQMTDGALEQSALELLSKARALPPTSPPWRSAPAPARRPTSLGRVRGTDRVRGR